MSLEDKEENINEKASNFLLNWVTTVNPQTLVEVASEINEFLKESIPNAVKEFNFLLTARSNSEANEIVSQCLKESKNKNEVRDGGKNEFYQEDTFLNYSNDQLAENLTLLEFELFRRISYEQLVSLKYPQCSADIVEFANHFNVISQWVTTEILVAIDEGRMEVVKKFIKFGMKLYKLNNFNGCMEVLCGITNSYLQRVKKVWDNISAKYLEKIKFMEEQLSPLRNFRTYRESFALSLRNTSVVPYLAAHIKDILIAEEGNPTKLEGNLLNYKKLILIGNISMDILDAQKIPFQHMQPDMNLLKYFRNLWWLEDDDLNIYSNILAAKKLNSSSTNSSTCI